MLEEGVVEAHALNAVGNGVFFLSDSTMDLTVLVAPLKTVDSIVKNNPLPGIFVGRNLASIPFSLKGDYYDPDISIIPPTAVGKGLVEVMERSLNLPVQLWDSFGSQKKSRAP